MDRDKAREYFEDAELTYEDIGESEIILLNCILKKVLGKTKNSKDTIALKGCDNFDITETPYKSLESCYLYVNSDYFDERECISFNDFGFIGFAHWADEDNIKPILSAFCIWVDIVKALKDVIL